MATKLEENFLTSWIKPQELVFEFGPGNCAWAASLPVNKFIGIDLYPPESTPPSNMDYRQGNLVAMSFPDKSVDVVACLSSFEHAGIEQPHFKDKQIDLVEHCKVAEALVRILKPGGKLLITMPAGADELYVVDHNGKSSLYETGTDFAWGFRTFTLARIQALFPTLKLLEAKAYLKTGEDYFATTSWTEILPEEISNIYSEQHGLLCVAFQG